MVKNIKLIKNQRPPFYDEKSFTYTYDEVGNKITETDPNEHTITFDYDYLNRLTTKTYPDQSTETYTYDKVSRMLTGINAESTLTYSYDELVLQRNFFVDN